MDKFGVTKNGIEYMRKGNTYYCSLYLGGGTQISRTFKGISRQKLENISRVHLMREHI